jgi:hypothetical protein
MTTNDYLNISTLDELRAARNSVSAAIKASERKFTGRIDSFRRYFSLGKILLPLIKKLRASISGTPFAQP